MKKLYVIALILTLCACGVQKKSEVELLESAKLSIDQGQKKAAMINLKNVLQVNANNIEARWLLGELYLDVGNGAAAEKELKKAINLGVSVDSVKPLLLKAFLAQGKYDEAISFEIFDLKATSSLSEAKTAKGLAHFYKKEIKLADEFISDALVLNPKSRYTLTVKALLNIAVKKLDEAQVVLDRALEIDDKDAFAWSVAGDLAQEKSDFEGAIQAYSNAVKYQTANSTYLIKRAFIYIRTKEYEKSQTDINVLKQAYSNAPQVNYAQGILYFHQEKFEEAQVAFEQALKFNVKDKWSTYYLGVSQFMIGKNESARTNLEAFVFALPSFIPSRKFLSLAYMKDDEFKKAEDLISPVLKKNPKDVFALSILGNSLLSQGRSSESIRAFEEVVRLNQDSAAGYLRLGVGQLTEGDESRGFDNLEKAVDIKPDFEQAQILLVLGYIKEGKLGDAQKSAKRFFEQQPNNVIANNLLGKVLVKSNQLEKASKYFQKARKLKPGDPESNIHLAAIALGKRDYNEVKKYYDEILKYNPSHMHALINLAALKAKQDDKAGALTILQRTVDLHPDAVQPRVLLATEYLKGRKFNKGVMLIRQVIEKKWGSEVLTALLAELQMASGDYAGAKQTLNQAIKAQAPNAITHFLLAKIHLKNKAFPELRQELEVALKLQPELTSARVMQTRLMLAEGEVAAAESNLEKLKKYAPKDDFNRLALEGSVFVKKGQYAAAQEKFVELYKKYPQNKAALRSYTRVLWLGGEKDKSSVELAAWLDRHPADIDILLELGGQYLRLDQVQSAVDVFQRILILEPANVMALNNLAFNLRETDTKQALIHAEKALFLAPKSLVVMDTLVGVLLEATQHQRAIQLAEQVVDAQPSNPNYRYHLAMVQEKMGDNMAAIANVKAILVNGDDFAEKSSAELALKRIKLKLK